MSYPWHSDFSARLAALAAADRVAGGVLISQPSGWGVAQAAADFAMHVLNLPPRSLDELREFAHPDLRLVERPPEKTRIAVDQIRSATEFVVGTAQHGRKVTLILGAEDMNPNAASALLKTLEEPPPGNVLVLATEAPGRLLPTVRSRCQHFASPAGDPAVAQRWLQAAGMSAADAELGLALAGAPLALVPTDQPAGGPGPARFVELLQALLTAADDNRHLEYARELADADLPQLFLWWLNAARLGLRAARGATPRLAGLDAELALLPADHLLAFIDVLTQARNVLRVNANRPMLVDRLAWQFANLAGHCPTAI